MVWRGPVRGTGGVRKPIRYLAVSGAADCRTQRPSSRDDFTAIRLASGPCAMVCRPPGG